MVYLSECGTRLNGAIIASVSAQGDFQPLHRKGCRRRRLHLSLARASICTSSPVRWVEGTTAKEIIFPGQVRCQVRCNRRWRYAFELGREDRHARLGYARPQILAWQTAEHEPLSDLAHAPNSESRCWRTDLVSTVDGSHTQPRNHGVMLQKGHIRPSRRSPL